MADLRKVGQGETKDFSALIQYSYVRNRSPKDVSIIFGKLRVLPHSGAWNVGDGQ
jgi:hypothetical protein